MNRHNLESINLATQAAIAAARDTPGLLKISAGNYGGRLGKSFIYLHGKNSALVQSANEVTPVVLVPARKRRTLTFS